MSLAIIVVALHINQINVQQKGWSYFQCEKIDITSVVSCSSTTNEVQKQNQAVLSHVVDGEEKPIV